MEAGRVGGGGGWMSRAASADWPAGSGSVVIHTRHTGCSDSGRADSVTVTGFGFGEDTYEDGESVAGGKSGPRERKILYGWRMGERGAGGERWWDGGTDGDVSCESEVW